MIVAVGWLVSCLLGCFDAYWSESSLVVVVDVAVAVAVGVADDVNSAVAVG